MKDWKEVQGWASGREVVLNVEIDLLGPTRTETHREGAKLGEMRSGRREIQGWPRLGWSP